MTPQDKNPEDEVLEIVNPLVKREWDKPSEAIEAFVVAFTAYGTRKREEAIRECAEIAKTEEIPCANPSDAIQNLLSRNPVLSVRAAFAATKNNIEDRILSLLPPPGGTTPGKERGE